ncbi:MAG TPA: choice-of-anchor Q domain-containing protein [Candidatus Solibacter sp.]|jgi:hypothetical protein|nr:choice-of-anchor Q domain-containing protein [Candidatus Solibacter sp.]
MGVGRESAIHRRTNQGGRTAGIGLSLLIAASTAVATSAPAHAASIVVTTTEDPALTSTSCPAAANPCSLRAAVAAANAAGGANAISFAVNGVFKVTAAAGGQINIGDQVTIAGNGKANTILDGQGEDHRILETGFGSVALSDLTIRNAHGLRGIQDSGAGILAIGGLTLTRVAVANNTVDANNSNTGGFGGGGVLAEGPLTIVDSSITGNTLNFDVTGRANAFAGGAGVLYDSFGSSSGAPVSVVIRNSLVSGNTVNFVGAGGGGLSGGGAGVFLEGAFSHLTTMTVDSTTMSGNQVLDHSTGGTFLITGGGMVADSAQSISVTNSTFDGNAAVSDLGPATGGGIGIGAPGATLTNVTISGNTAAAGSGLYVEQAPTRLRSTILSSSSASGCATAFGGTIVSIGDNLDNGTSCGFNQPSDQNGVDPLLGPLQDNGGPTPTRALLFGSPAIDAVATSDCPPPTVDQRGVSRPQGPRCDIGAVEMQHRKARGGHATPA